VKRSEQFAEIREIADAICNYSATTEQKQRLEQLLDNNIDAQQFYYDYISMHMQLEAAVEQNMEFVYRRMTEEFVVRPKGDEQTIATITPTEQLPNTTTNSVSKSNKLRQMRSHVFIVLCLLIAILTALLTWQLFNQSTAPFNAQILQGHLSIVSQGNIADNNLFAGEYRVEQDAEIALPNDVRLHLTAHTVIKLFNGNELQLKRGLLKLVAVSKQKIIVHTPSFSVNANGDDLTIDLTQPEPILTTGANTLLLPSRWRPKHFWPFESHSDRVIDLANNAVGIAGKSTRRTKGLVGQGSYYFNNHSTDRIDLGSGGGTVPASGSFAVSDGVTLEVLLAPEYSGELGDIDQIFSKDTGDEKLRMVLGFQHNSRKQDLMPDIDVNESLEFGLYILGQGYHRLKLPLDGQQGRPTLAQLKDGKMHHVVASYDVSTGLKALYIDGQLLASYQYPPGSKMLTGGPGNATIGNTQGHKRWQEKSYAGVIDEVAFYDFALPKFVVQQHWQHTQQGKNYFGLPANAEPLPVQLTLLLPAQTTLALAPITGLPKKIMAP